MKFDLDIVSKELDESIHITRCPFLPAKVNKGTIPE